MKTKYRWRLALVFCTVFDTTSLFAAHEAALPTPLDEAMEKIYPVDPPSLALTGKIVNIPEKLKGRIEITGSYVELDGQVPVVSKLADDGTFRMEIPGGVPARELWLTVKPLYYGRIVLTRGLHIDVDPEKFAEKKGAKYVSPGVSFTGPDAELAGIVNGLVVFERRPWLDR